MSSVNGKHIVAYAILSIKKNYTLSTHVVHSFKANKSLNYAIITHQYSFTASCVWLFSLYLVVIVISDFSHTKLLQLLLLFYDRTDLVALPIHCT